MTPDPAAPVGLDLAQRLLDRLTDEIARCPFATCPPCDEKRALLDLVSRQQEAMLQAADEIEMLQGAINNEFGGDDVNGVEMVLRSLLPREPKRPEGCSAVLHTGPGHQSIVRCDMKGEHTEHSRPKDWYTWEGDEAFEETW